MLRSRISWKVMLSTCILFFNQIHSSSNKPELKLKSPPSHELKPSNQNKPKLKLSSPNLYELKQVWAQTQ
jgi:hypothetical protein